MGLFRRKPGKALVPYSRGGNPNSVSAKHNTFKRELEEIKKDSPDALTAGGALVRSGQPMYLRRLIMPWQIRSFGYYDLLGEIKYAAQFYSRALAALKLYAAEIDEDDEIVPTTNQVAIDALARIKDPGGSGRTELLATYGRLMFLVGEALLFVSKNPHTEIEQWEMLSTDELRLLEGSYTRFKAPVLPAVNFKPAPNDSFEPVDDDDAVAYRLWKKHPRFSELPDATMEGILDLCEELVLLTQAVRARARSRLAGSGILFLDDRITTRPQEPTPDEDPYEDPTLEDLTEAMTAPITDEGTASAIVPLIARCRVPDGMKLADLVYHLQIIDPTQFYPETGLRMECIKRIAIGLDMPPEILLGMQDSNHWCVDEETEILTTDGWKRYGEFSVDDEVLTLNHESGMSEWKPVLEIAEFEVLDLPMRSIETRYHSSLTTMNHRWPVLAMKGAEGRWERDWAHSDELRTTHRIVTAAPSRDSLLPQFVQHDDALVELVAWLWTEGSIQERAGRKTPKVAIYQSHTANLDHVLRIRAALTSLFGVGALVPMQSDRRRAEWSDAAWRETRRGGKTVFSLNRSAAARLLEHVDGDRVVSTDFIRTLTASQLALFVDTSVKGDGSVQRSGSSLLGQKDRARLFPFELAAMLLGRSTLAFSQEHKGFKDHVQHYISVSERATVRLKKRQIRTESYTGIVWCPVTENRTWAARRNGKIFFTGNSAWQIDEQVWKAHLQPIANQLVADLTQAYLGPYLKSQGVKDWDRYVIAYDAADIINHPDRTKDALQLHDRGIVGDEAVRDAAGFDDADKPSEEELARIVGMAVRDASLAWDGIPSLKAGGIEPEPGVVQTGAAPEQGAPTSSGGAGVEKGPPPGGQPQSAEETIQASAQVAMIEGAAQLALLRAREAAGAKLLTAARRRSEMAEVIAGVKTRDIPSALGRVRVQELLNGHKGEAELVSGAHGLILDALRMFGVPDAAVAEAVAQTIEAHAARTIYDARPAPLPPNFAAYVTGLLETARNGT